MNREQRLRKSNDFRALYRDGVKVRLQGLVVYGRPFAFETHRMGVVASRKIGSAVVRNRFKRRMRTFFGYVKALPVPCDVVWIATQPQGVRWSFAELQALVKEGCEKFRRLLDGRLRKRGGIEVPLERASVEA